MNRRSLLKTLPLVALVGASVKVGDVEAKAFEMKSGKKYLFVIPDVPRIFATRAAKQLRARGIDAVVVAGDMALAIHELDAGISEASDGRLK